MTVPLDVPNTAPFREPATGAIHAIFDQASDTLPRELLRAAQFQKLDAKSFADLQARQFPSVDEFQVTVTRVNETHHLEIQIEVVGGGEAKVGPKVEHAPCHALSPRPKVTVAAIGTLARFELKARRFRRLD